MLAGFDTETALIARGEMAPRLACASFTPEGGAPYLVHHAGGAVDAFEARLTAPGALVGTNIAYDIAVMLQAAAPENLRLTQQVFHAYEQGKILDIMIAARLNDIATGVLNSERNREGEYSLSAIAESFGWPPLEKDEWRLRFGELIDVPLGHWPEGAVNYAKNDSDLPPKLLRMMVEHYDPSFPGIYDRLGIHCYNHFAGHLISCHGIRTDALAVARFKVQVGKALLHARELLLNAGLLGVHRTGVKRGKLKRNTKAAQIYMQQACEAADMAVPHTKTGAIKLNKDAVGQLGDPVMDAYALWTGQTTLASRLQILAQGSTRRLQSRFVYPLETSRYSCRHPSAPLVGDQLQNAPKVAGYRECYVPGPGKVFIIADFSGMELACIAQNCLWTVGKSKLADMLNDDIDPHAWLGAKAIGASYEDVVRAKHEGGPKHLVDARQLGKVGNFSFWGMAGPKAIVVMARVQYGVILTLQQAHALQTTVRTHYPEIQDYHAYVNATLARTGGAVRSHHPCRDLMGGGPTYFESDWRGGCRGPDGANHGFQRLGADGSNAALRALQRTFYSEPSSVLFGSRTVIWFHDEAVWESDESIGHECAMAGKAIMEPAFRSEVRDVKSEIEPVVARCWSKKAKQVWEGGRLVPWSPA